MFTQVLNARDSNTSEVGRNIVICCDGTGNEFGDANSNVVKLYQTLVIDEHQLGYYHPGVGTMGAPNARGRLEREWTRLEGLAIGAGLMENVGDAYRYLMNTYREGDKIFLFGFSRGAYTARVLAGALHVCGLLCSGNEGLIPYVLKMFANQSRERRREGRLDVAEKFKNAFSRDVLVHFVGVWDTVSSIGWIYDPVVLPFEGRNPIIRTGRHALAIDERRCYYGAKLWGRPFMPSEHAFRTEQDIKQVWFGGVHSDVGGSYPEAESGLSKLALEWMLHEAFQFGMRIDILRLALLLGRLPAGCTNSRYAPPNSLAYQHESLKDAWWALEYLPHADLDLEKKKMAWHVPRGASRIIPNGSLIHASVVQRMNTVPSYRPVNLPVEYMIEPRTMFPAPRSTTLTAAGPSHSALSAIDNDAAHVRQL